jgi:hypothetical protein
MRQAFGPAAFFVLVAQALLPVYKFSRDRRACPEPVEWAPSPAHLHLAPAAIQARDHTEATRSILAVNSRLAVDSRYSLVN